MARPSIEYQTEEKLKDRAEDDEQGGQIIPAPIIVACEKESISGGRAYFLSRSDVRVKSVPVAHQQIFH